MADNSSRHYHLPALTARRRRGALSTQPPRLHILSCSELIFFSQSYLFFNVNQVVVKWPRAAHFNRGRSPPSRRNQQSDLIPILLQDSARAAGKRGAGQRKHERVAAFASPTNTHSTAHKTDANCSALSGAASPLGRSPARSRNYRRVATLHGNNGFFRRNINNTVAS